MNEVKKITIENTDDGGLLVSFFCHDPDWGCNYVFYEVFDDTDRRGRNFKNYIKFLKSEKDAFAPRITTETKIEVDEEALSCLEFKLNK